MRFPFLIGLLSSVAMAGCNSDGAATSDLGLPAFDLSMPTLDLNMPVMDLGDPADMMLIPSPPALGPQIDRAGRPLINQFLTNPFELVSGMTTPQTQDAYNAAASSNWSSFAPRPYVAESLAGWDGIDGNCGNQLLAGSGAMRYVPLSMLLAQDYLLIETSKQSCQRYLAVELNDANECGGRAPHLSGTNNVVDVTLNLLQGGSPPPVALSNGVNADPDGAPIMSFPFLLPST